MEIRELSKLKSKVEMAQAILSDISESLIGEDFIIANVPKPERKSRKRYTRKAKKEEVTEAPAPVEEKPRKRAKKNPFYDETPNAEV
jgi:hypothetical protein